MWVIDNFLPESLHQDLKRLVMGNEIDWTYVLDHEHQQDDFYFIHNVIRDGHESRLFDDIKPVLYFMDDKLGFVIENILRINCKLTTNHGRRNRETMHMDFTTSHYTGIYYINSSNGPTVVEDTEVECVANRFLLFDGLKMHCGTTPDDCHARFNIVFNMEGHFRK